MRNEYEEMRYKYLTHFAHIIFLSLLSVLFFFSDNVRGIRVLEVKKTEKLLMPYFISYL